MSESGVSALQEYRCRKCRKLLFRGEPLRTTVEIKCKRCGRVSLFGADGSYTAIFARESGKGVHEAMDVVQ